MNTIILFGASRGGENFIKNNHDKYEIIAVVDNDVTKQGELICNIPIIAAEEINSCDYDYIIVASMYVHSITEQLMTLGIDEKKIKYASKNAMKVVSYPFQDTEVLKRANRMIRLFSEILIDVRYFYTFGTLLGIVRDGRLIPWDDDIDIAIFAEDAPKVKRLLLENIEQVNDVLKTKMYLRYYSDNQIASITIDCYHLGDLMFNINFDCIYVTENIAKQELNETPLVFFEIAETYEFKGHMIKVPQNYENYLTYTYGDWQTVKKNTSFYDNTLNFIEPKLSCTSDLIYDGVNDEKDLIT